MKTKEILSQRYAQKCQELADLILNKEKIEERISSVKRDIDILNAALPICEQVEASIVSKEVEPANE